MGDIAVQWGPIAALVAASGYLLLLALAARSRGFPGPAERWFAAYLLVSAVWTVAWAIHSLWRGLPSWVVNWGGSLAVYTAALLPPALAVLTLHFLPRRGAKAVAVVGLGWAVAVILVERGVVDLSQTETVLDFLRLAGWTGFILGSVALTTSGYVRLRQPLHRNRLLYWLVALVLVALGEGLHHLRNEGVAELGLPLRLLGATLMTYAISTYSQPDLKSVGRRVLLLIVVTLVRALLYLAAIVGAVAAYQFVRRASLDEQQFLWLTVTGGIVGALLLAVLQVPILNVIVGTAERLLFGPGYDANRALRDYNRNISNILQIERLAIVANETIAEALDVTRGALLVITERDDGGADVRVVPGMGDIAAMNVAFAPGSPVLGALRDANQTLTQYDIDMLAEFRSMDPEERQWQWAMDVEVYVPICRGESLIGALVLGAKQAGDPYDTQDVLILNTLAHQTAIALENARLFDDQRQENRKIRQVNEELLAANARLEMIDAARKNLLGITSRELRGPLTQLRGYAYVLDETVSAQEVERPRVVAIAGRIRAAVDRLEAISSGMLDSLGSGENLLHLGSVQPVSCIVQAVTRVREALDRRQQEIVMNGIRELPLLTGDQEPLIEAFSRLINSAVQWAPVGGRIEIQGRPMPGQESVIEIVIADQRAGIDFHDDAARFPEYLQTHDSDVGSVVKGSISSGELDSGLSFAKGVIEYHGGRIWLESDASDTARRFHILLPLRNEQSHKELVSERAKKMRPITGLAKYLKTRAGQTRRRE